MTRPPVWIFGRADRLSALADRCTRRQDDLYREKCDAPDPYVKAGLDRQIATYRRRFLILAACARQARRLAKLATA